MYLRHGLFFGFGVTVMAITMAASFSANASDSTVLSTANINTIQSIHAISVLHILYISSPGILPSCPTSTLKTVGSWSGDSPTENAGMAGPAKFFPLGPTTQNSTGYWVFNCLESYWTSDPYYIQLLATANSNSYIGCQAGGGNCTLANNLSGIVPIHFIFKTPAQTIVRNYNGGWWNRIGSMTPAAGPFILTQGTAMPGLWGSTTAQSDVSYPFTVGSSYQLILSWQIIYTQSDSAGGGYSLGGAGNNNFRAFCPASTSFYTLNITSDMIGKTCEIGCSDANWQLWASPNPDNSNSTNTVTLQSPVTLNCY